jgi:gluconate 2-dehydrogenase subunit 3-like protein
MRGLMDVKPLPMTPLVPDAIAEASTGFFSERQMATLRHLGDILQPAYNGYPSSSEAGAPEFLDFLIGISPQEQQAMYQSGLDRLESEATQKFSKSFAELNEGQADQLIRPVLRPWLNEHPPTEPYEKFMSLVQNDIRAATVNSQAWSEAARKGGKETPNVDLYWYPIDPDLHRENSASMTRNINSTLKN